MSNLYSGQWFIMELDTGDKMTPDIVNGLFELLGAYFTWMNAYRLWKDREIKGVYWPATAFFAAWGMWNLFYYPALGQWCSFCGGAVLVIGNMWWVVMALRLKFFTTSPV